MVKLPPNVKSMKVNKDGTCEVAFSKKPYFMYVVFERESERFPLELVYMNNGWVGSWCSLKVESKLEYSPLVTLEFYPFI